jgi:glycosyltransferase involved in cell wall biosynthesis
MAEARNARTSSRQSTCDVTVVMALYNGGELVRESLESIVTQSVPPRQIIVVDDGSKDASPELVAGFAKAHRGPSQVTVIRKENGGQGSARNVGAGEATTDFVAFIDQDDTWPHNHLEVLLEGLADEPERGWIYSDFRHIDAEGQTVRRNFLKQTHYSVPEQSLNGMLRQDLMMLPSASLIRTRAFREGGGFDTQFRGYEDDDLFLRIFQAGWGFAFEPRDVTNYRIHDENSSRQSSFLRSRERFYLKYRDVFEALGPDDVARYRGLIAGRMTRSFINDAVALNRDSIPGDFRSELRRVASSVLGDIGWSPKRRVVMLLVRHTWLVPFLLRMNAMFKRSGGSRRDIETREAS